MSSGGLGDVLHSQMTRTDHIINALEMTNEARQGEEIESFCVIETD